MRTRITELFGIETPILLSGMSWISTPPLAAAVSNAGGLGLLATGVSNPDQVGRHIAELRQLTGRPFGANVTLYFPAARQNAEVLIRERVPVINYSLGKGDWIAEAVHAYGGKVVATVTTAKHALAAQRDGADGVIVTGHEAAGHGGAVTSLVLVPRLAELLEVPVIAAGGFADGRGLAAALALGAEGVAMGTRFMDSVESPVHQAQKRVCNEVDVQGTIYTDKVDGLPGRMLRSGGAQRLMRAPINPVTALIQSRRIAAMLGLPWLKLAAGILLSGPKTSLQMARMARGFAALEAATLEGDNERGVLPIGQVAGLCHDTLPVAEIMRRMTEQAEAVARRTAGLFDGREVPLDGSPGRWPSAPPAAHT